MLETMCGDKLTFCAPKDLLLSSIQTTINEQYLLILYSHLNGLFNEEGRS